MKVATMKLFLTLILAQLGITPAWCESCGEMWEAHQLEAHVFEEWHEHEDENGGTHYEIEAYTLDICPVCVDYWTE